MPKVDWLWLAIGIVLALFVFPMIQAWFASRGSSSGDTSN